MSKKSKTRKAGPGRGHKTLGPNGKPLTDAERAKRRAAYMRNYMGQRRARSPSNKEPPAPQTSLVPDIHLYRLADGRTLDGIGAHNPYYDQFPAGFVQFTNAVVQIHPPAAPESPSASASGEDDTGNMCPSDGPESSES